MPIYRYRCTVCGHEFEDLAGVKDPNRACPNQDWSSTGAACMGDTVKVPVPVGPPQGGPTPRFYRGWSH
jgi:putative FmdB family regulatory protein